MTLDEFLQQKWPNNSYIEYPGFESLYVRKGDIFVNLEGKLFRCHPTFHVANMTAKTPRQGEFTALVADLESRGFAVYVECVHERAFAIALGCMGFTRINKDSGRYFLKNYEGKLTEHVNLYPKH